MQQNVGNRLPSFTEEQKRRVTGSWDIFYLNHYSTQYYTSAAVDSTTGWLGDQGTSSGAYNSQGVQIGPQAASPWLYVVPWGIHRVLVWNHNRYKDATFNGKSENGSKSLPFIITENGVDVPNESEMSLQDALNDTFRISYYKDYLANVKKAIDENKVEVCGYFAWSLLDNFEWTDGFEMRFGMTYVNFTTLERFPKASFQWFSDFAANNKMFGTCNMGKSKGIIDYMETMYDQLGLVQIVTLVITAIVMLALCVTMIQRRRGTWARMVPQITEAMTRKRTNGVQYFEIGRDEEDAEASDFM